jgi:Domain of unknown function (DUF4194)
MQPQSPQPYASVIIKLLQGAIYSDDAPHWDRLQSYLPQVREYFSKIGLRVQNYETDGFAYLEQPDPDPEERAEVLPRLTIRRSLTFEMTVLCVLLREQLRLFDASDATGRLVLSIKKIRDLLQLYLPDGNNESKLHKKVDSLVTQAIELGFLRIRSEGDNSYEVRAILKAKISADHLESLKQKLENYANPPTPQSE